jgi:hypothetical protein
MSDVPPSPEPVSSSPQPAGRPMPPPLGDYPRSIPDPTSWRWFSRIIDHNPCFLLSAFLMFLGCYLLNSAMDVRAADVGKSLLLLATINVYEAALIALGLALIPRRDGRGRDGVLLLFVQILFLADGPFLIAQLVQAAPRWGWVIALVLAALAVVKVVIVQRVLRIPARGRTLGFLVLQLLLLYGLPVILSHTNTAGELSAKAMFACWWVVGMLPAFYEVLASREGLPHLARRRHFLRRSFVIVPWLLLVAHVAFFHYVYHADFVAADLSPVLIGLAVATRRLAPSWFLPANQLRVVRLALPAIAVLLAIFSERVDLVLPLTTIAVTPAALTAAVAIVVYGYLHSRLAAGSAIVAIVLMVVGRVLIDDILRALRAMVEGIVVVFEKLVVLVPTTAGAWGIVAIVGAFVLLGLGGLYSLRPERRDVRSS